MRYRSITWLYALYGVAAARRHFLVSFLLLWRCLNDARPFTADRRRMLGVVAMSTTQAGHIIRKRQADGDTNFQHVKA